MTGKPRLLLKLALAVAVVAVAGGALYAGYGLLRHRDFRVICDAYTKGSVQSLGDDPATEAYEIARYIDGNTFTRPARAAVSAAGYADAKDRYELIRLAAADAGWTDWDCPAMRDYLRGAVDTLAEPEAPAGD